MKYQRNIYFKYNTCTIEEHVHEISTIIMLIYVKFMKCWAKFKTIVNDEDIRVIQGYVLWRKACKEYELNLEKRRKTAIHTAITH